MQHYDTSATSPPGGDLATPAPEDEGVANMTDRARLRRGPPRTLALQGRAAQRVVIMCLTHEEYERLCTQV